MQMSTNYRYLLINYYLIPINVKLVQGMHNVNKCLRSGKQSCGKSTRVVSKDTEGHRMAASTLIKPSDSALKLTSTTIGPILSEVVGIAGNHQVLVAIFVKLLISQKEISKFVILDRKQLVNVRPKLK
jgi:hypothetical protein